MAQFSKFPQVWKLPNETKPICTTVHYSEAEPYCFENLTRSFRQLYLNVFGHAEKDVVRCPSSGDLPCQWPSYLHCHGNGNIRGNYCEIVSV